MVCRLQRHPWYNPTRGAKILRSTTFSFLYLQNIPWVERRFMTCALRAPRAMHFVKKCRGWRLPQYPTCLCNICITNCCDITWLNWLLFINKHEQSCIAAKYCILLSNSASVFVVVVILVVTLVVIVLVITFTIVITVEPSHELPQKISTI